jgi:hypothetical protein
MPTQVVSYTITQQVLVRAIMLLVAPSLANDTCSHKGRVVWLGLTLALLTFCYLVANSTLLSPSFFHISS